MEAALVGRPTCPARIETGRWYDIRIEVKARARCYLDGKLIQEVSLAPWPLQVVTSRVNASGEIIVKMVKSSYTSQDVEIDLRGVQSVAPTASAVVLTSAKETDENSLIEPTKVAPVSQTIENVSRTFRHTLPANSVTILRLKAKYALFTEYQ